MCIKTVYISIWHIIINTTPTISQKNIFELQNTFGDMFTTALLFALLATLALFQTVRTKDAFPKDFNLYQATQDVVRDTSFKTKDLPDLRERSKFAAQGSFSEQPSKDTTVHLGLDIRGSSSSYTVGAQFSPNKDTTLSAGAGFASGQKPSYTVGLNMNL